MSNLNAEEAGQALTLVVGTTWPLPTPTRLTSLGAGQNSLVYRVEAHATESRILKVYRNHADVARVQYEVALLNALRGAPLPFPLPTPLSTREGTLIHQLSVESGNLSGALAVLWTELPGSHPDPSDERQAHVAAAALALLDLALADIDSAMLPGRPTLPLHELRRRVSAPDDVEDALLQLPLHPQEITELLRLLEQVEAQIPPLYAHLPQQLVHADLDPTQVLMEGDQVTGIIDFEFSHHDLRIYDLAVPLALWPRDIFDTGAEWKLMEALGCGYTAHLRLLPQELRTLPLLLRVRAIGGLLRDIGWQRQGRVSMARVVDHAAYTLARERWLQRNEPRLLAMAYQWCQ
jgi:homoserine kinase type II